MNDYEVKNSAQSYLNNARNVVGSASCGASDPDPKETEQPSACGASCGASDPDPKEPEPKEPEQPSACGASCGAGDK